MEACRMEARGVAAVRPGWGRWSRGDRLVRCGHKQRDMDREVDMSQVTELRSLGRTFITDGTETQLESNQTHISAGVSRSRERTRYSTFTAEIGLHSKVEAHTRVRQGGGMWRRGSIMNQQICRHSYQATQSVLIIEYKGLSYNRQRNGYIQLSHLKVFSPCHDPPSSSSSLPPTRSLTAR